MEPATLTAVGTDCARILRSVLMKPEAEQHVERIHARAEQLAKFRRST